jgi:hypothetical protein
MPAFSNRVNERIPARTSWMALHGPPKPVPMMAIRGDGAF